MSPTYPRLRRRVLIGLFVGSALALAAVTGLLLNISERKSEERQYPLILNKLSDDQVDPAVWGVSFPAQYGRYRLMAEPGTATNYGGGHPYSKLMRNPALRRLWGGYPFSLDFNEDRSHYFAAIDQFETKRNDKDWINAHGLPGFKGQPGACMNCHSGWAPSLIRELGWETFNHTPYNDLKGMLIKQHGAGMAGHALGSTCADCHHPSDMSLRVTRPAYINAMVARGYKGDPKAGLLATHEEMRSHVCQQCHVEYYFKGEQKVLTFPWSQWPKNEPLRIEMIEAYYDREAARPDGFKADWTHGETGAPMLKMQHPETELYSSSVHARTGVSCADCHMPYRREGAVKVTDHFIASPLLNINASCQTCHHIAEEKLRARVDLIQQRTATQLKEAEGAILALMDDIVAASKELDKERVKGTSIPDDVYKAKVDKVLAAARQAHRRASMRWDFISSENSTGFHSPQEAARVLGAATQLARVGQLSLVNDLATVGIHIRPTAGYGLVPAAGNPIEPRHAPVGDPPGQALLDLDLKVEAMITPLGVAGETTAK